ncbi:SOS response-associated peptidase [Parasalinivibrio latis]|uniref:SOS response-associated peptidase n=1 Tax=Parasalinivibrio latis TaxID=2952610 RepID=UPI0030DE8DB1
MCGRINVSDDPLAKFITDTLGMPFHTRTNPDLRPTDPIDVIVGKENPRQLTLHWGIKPDWAKRPIINAQAETAAVKPTFRQSFHQFRCLVPCSGWYEWTPEDPSEPQRKKLKYLFTGSNGEPIFMAGLMLPDCKLVTLTTPPDEQYSRYHHRMPMLVAPEKARKWLTDTGYAGELAQAPHQYNLDISPIK